MRNLKNICGRLLACLLLLWCFWPPGLTLAAEQPQVLPETVTMSREQFLTLKTRIATLEGLLTQLQQELALQSSTSSELIPLVTKLQTELKAAKLELAVAKTSLGDAKTKLELANQSLQTLSAQIKAERQRSKVNQIRTVLYTALATLAADRIYLATK